MTNTTVSGKWYEQIDNLKAKFSILMGADLTYCEGKKDEMSDKVQNNSREIKEKQLQITQRYNQMLQKCR